MLYALNRPELGRVIGFQDALNDMDFHTDGLVAIARRLAADPRVTESKPLGDDRDYIAAFLAGYDQFRRSGRVTKDNVFLQRYAISLAEIEADPGIVEILNDRDRMVAVIEDRYIAMDENDLNQWFVPRTLM